MTDIVAELRARAQQGRFNLEAADEIERLRAELNEQCRLLGMSAEREAKQLAQQSALEKERDAMRAELDALKGQTIDRSVDKAFARFAGVFWKSPDAPYPGMIEAFENHYGQDFRDKDWRNEAACWAAAWHRAVHRPIPASAQNAGLDFSDAYQGAMEEVAIWKKRALEAEELNRKFIAEINGPTHMGEPLPPAPSVPDEPSSDWFDCLIADISSIPSRYHGDPSYDHDAYWMREEVIRMLEKRKAAAPKPEAKP